MALIEPRLTDDTFSRAVRHELPCRGENEVSHVGEVRIA